MPVLPMGPLAVVPIAPLGYWKLHVQDDGVGSGEEDWTTSGLTDPQHLEVGLLR